MRLAVLKERRANETRVAATPETVRKLAALGLTVAIEQGAGAGASIPDAEFTAAGAEIVPDARSALAGAGVVFAVQPPDGPALQAVPRGALLVCTSGAMADRASVAAYAQAGIDVAAMELLPRITRAQSMDILSSQANLAGYRAVIEGAAAFDRGFPMMMTAAGTVPPARVFVIGAGVAGLQAIATARRLGAIVSATDVRPAAKEEIKSLGATFVGVEDTETATQTGAYAKEMSDAFRQKQAELMATTVAKNDMVICTALVQGGKAPVIVTQAMVDSMKPGSVIVDIAADGGGNCAATRPGEAYTTERGVKVLGYRNWPGRISVAASNLYAKNLLTFLTSFWDKDAKAPKLPAEDAIVQGVMLTRGGAVVHAHFADKSAEPAAAAPAHAEPPAAPPVEPPATPVAPPAEENPSAASATVPEAQEDTTPEPAAAPEVRPRAGEYRTTSTESAESASAEPTVTGSHEEALAPEMPEHEAASLPAEPSPDANSASPEPTASGLYGDAVPPAPGGSAGTIEDAQPAPDQAEPLPADPALAPQAETQPGTPAAAPKAKAGPAKPKGGGGKGGGGGKTRPQQKPAAPRGPGGQT
jgi:NAD(P) transhydrogenase subunit alpha